jgi:small GTP-binding protein
MSPIVFPQEINHKIVFVGLPKAGKTTLVRRLRHGDDMDPKVTTTVGVAIELIEYVDSSGVSTQYLALDCGGQLEFAKALWQPHVEASDGVCFLFDSTDNESVQAAKHWLDEVLSWIDRNTSSKDTPLLFLANKSDLATALTMKEIIEKLQLKNIQKKSFGIYQISALKGSQVDEAFDWFFERISR